MKILVAHWRTDIVSGAELAIADMVSEHSPGFDYVMLTPGEGPLADYYHNRGFAVWKREVPTRRRIFPGRHTLHSLSFARELQRSRVDLVLCNTFPAASRVGLACRLARKPYAIYVREYVRNCALHRRMLNKANRVLAVSADVADYLGEFIPSRNISIAHDHVDAVALVRQVRQHRESGKRILPFGKNHPVVGYLGRITPYKQPDLFLRAIPTILEQEPSVKFIVVGKATERERQYEGSLRELARQLNIVDRVVFMGQRSDVPGILSELAICCCPSTREPFPRIILEAQAAGRPVVASNTGGCPEMIEDNVSGLLFPVQRPDAARHLGEQVLSLLKNPAKATALAIQAQKRMVETFASLRPVQDFEAILRQLCEAEPKATATPLFQESTPVR